MKIVLKHITLCANNIAQETAPRKGSTLFKVFYQQQAGKKNA